MLFGLYTEDFLILYTGIVFDIVRLEHGNITILIADARREP